MPFKKKPGKEIADDQSTENLDKDLRHLALLISDLPDLEPPNGLVPSVMSRIEPKKINWWKRWWHWMKVPAPISPIRLAPLGVALLLFILLLTNLFRVPKVRENIVQDIARIEDSRVQVVFSLEMPEASQVEVIGSFNRWSPKGFQMQWDKERKVWIIALRLEKGRHEYAFLVDGSTIVPDPQSLIQQDDGFGNKNSVIILGGANNHESI